MKNPIDIFRIHYANFRLFKAQFGSSFRQQNRFLLNIGSTALNSVITAVVLIAVFLTIDWLLIEFYSLIQTHLPLIPKLIETEWGSILAIFSLSDINYFVELVNITAGLFGVILGLLFTSYYTIISTKYVDASSTIRLLLLRQKFIRKYLAMLATLAALSILFQYTLSIGYKPSFFITVLFVLTILFAFLSFSKIGLEGTAFLFERQNLIEDVFTELQIELSRVILYRLPLEQTKRSATVKYKVNHALDAYKSVLNSYPSSELRFETFTKLGQSIYNLLVWYSRNKHQLPTTEEWQQTKRKFRSLEDVSAHEWMIADSTRTTLFPTNEIDYIWVEKRILEPYINFAKSKITNDQVSNIAYGMAYLHNYVGQMAWQWQTELFEFFMGQIEDFTKTVVNKASISDSDKLKVLELHMSFITSHFAGLIQSIEKMEINHIIKVSTSVHSIEKHESKAFFPSSLRKWVDGYEKKLKSEKYYESKKLTPLWYTQDRFAFEFQQLLCSYFYETAQFSHNKLPEVVEYLQKNNEPYLALNYAIMARHVRTKLDYLSTMVAKFVENINVLNKTNQNRWEFEQKDSLLRSNIGLDKRLLDAIWRLGPHSLGHNNEELDVFGEVYRVLLKSLTDSLIDRNANDQVFDRLKKLSVIILMHLEKIMLKYKSEDSMRWASIQYPFIMDLLQLNSLGIIFSRIMNKPSFENDILTFWDKVIEEEGRRVPFWQRLIEIYRIMSDPLYSMSTNSWHREDARKSALFNYLIEESVFVEKWETNSGFRSSFKRLKSNVPDPVLNFMAENADVERSSFTFMFKLEEVFLYYYLEKHQDFHDFELNLKYSE